jgi:hypothetical protein
MSGRPELPPIPPGFSAVSSQMLDEEEDGERRRPAAMPDDLTVATWNVEWAPPGKRDAIRRRLASINADVIVLTEGDVGVLPTGGHVIDGGPDWGYDSPDPARRKIILWSRFPLLFPDAVGSADLPPGRFVAATVETGRGPVRIVGVCIPWFDAHVRTGRMKGTRKRWDEHLAYLGPLEQLLISSGEQEPTCVLGDFNQRFPRSSHCPEHVHGALLKALTNYRVVTEDDVAGLREQTVDHIATSRALSARDVRGRDRHADDEPTRALSDHDLVACRITREPSHGPRRWASGVPTEES